MQNMSSPKLRKGWRWILTNIGAPLLVFFIISLITRRDKESENPVSNYEYSNIVIENNENHYEAKDTFTSSSSEKKSINTPSEKNNQSTNEKFHKKEIDNPMTVIVGKRLKNGKIYLNDKWIANAPARIYLISNTLNTIRVEQDSFFYEERIVTPTNRKLINILDNEAKKISS